MTISTGAILRVVASMVFDDGNVAQNVYGAVVSGAGGPWDEADIVADAKAWLGTMYANLTAFTTDTLSGDEVQVYEWDPVGNDFEEIGTDFWTWVGTVTADALPRGVSGKVLAKTTNSDVNGAKFLAGLTENHNGDAQWVSGLVTAMGAYATDWTSAFTGATSGATWTPGIYSPTKVSFYTCSGSTQTKTEPSYQRGRARGVGI